VVNRERLRQANVHALRRWRAFGGGQLWQRFRKVTAPCSCCMCGNRRRFGELTRQERRQREEVE